MNIFCKGLFGRDGGISYYHMASLVTGFCWYGDYQTMNCFYDVLIRKNLNGHGLEGKATLRGKLLLNSLHS